MWGFLTSLIHGGDDDVTLRAAHENVPIDVRIQSTLNSVELVVEFSAVTLFCVVMSVTIKVNSVKCRFIFKTLFSRGLLICTLISKNQGLFQTCKPGFFPFFHLEKKLGLYYKPENNPGDKLKNPVSRT